MQLSSSGPDETLLIGRKLGRFLKNGDMVCFYGEIGAGKTAMIKGIASAFGIEEREVTSASFTIIAEYDTSPHFCHVDLYRLEDDADVYDTGLYDYLDKDGVTVIEWAERLEDVPENAITVRIDIAGDRERKIVIEGLDEKDWNNMQER